MPPRSFRSVLPGLLPILALLAGTGLRAQQTTDVGTGDITNGPFDLPAPYGNWTNGARHQMLFRASELHAAGMLAGTVQSLAFHVVSPAQAPLEGFTIRTGTTTLSQLGPTWVDGLSSAYGPLTYTDAEGWNTHVFDTPFVWDGTSNLVIETCFRSPSTTFNAEFLQTVTPFVSTCILANADEAICSDPVLQPFGVAQRPVIRFTWLQAPPQALFHQSAGQSCTGTVHFQDASINAPTAWQWDLGDGTLVDAQNVIHTYATSGTYTATLTVSNAFGTTAITGDPITVDLDGPRPIPACAPVSTGTIAGFGITQVSVNDVVTPSADAALEGYADHGCMLIPVNAGAPVALDVITGPATTQNVRAWVDWDNDGAFSASEAVLAANSVMHADTVFTVPASAPIGTPLRLRVMADYDLAAPPQPCTPPQLGQAEDYGLLIAANTLAPDAQFTATPSYSCNGTVQFMDASLHVPTTWSWDFGDGGSSLASSPEHTYAASGPYTVTLTASNAFGTDALSLPVMVDLNGLLVPAACTPQTQAPCCGYGITALTFADIAITNASGSTGYLDRGCGNTAHVEAGHSYPLTIGTGGDNGHDVAVWLDLDNDGSFAESERLFAAFNEQDPAGNLTVPNNAVIGVPLRLRVIADVVGEVDGPCDPPVFGQCEDVSVIVSPNPDPPVAAFSASPLVACEGGVQFTDASAGVPTAWAWTFGDGGTSGDPSPFHQYTAPESYDVALTVTNANGSDTHAEPAYIEVPPTWLCDTLRMPMVTDTVITACDGLLTDDGGAGADYSPGLGRRLTIAPPGATSIVLTFSQFAFSTGTDFLDIYEGPDTLGLSLGAYTGSALPGVITSATGAITLQQRATGPAGSSGFMAIWACHATGIAEHAALLIISIHPQPADDGFTVGFSRPATPGWRLTIHNALGAKIAEGTPQAGTGQFIFDTVQWAPGCYLLTLDTGTERCGRTVIVR